MVYVLNREGKPLMPTTRYGRVRRLLRKGHAVVVDYRPFTIQLTYDTPNGVQEVSLGVDAGTKHVGFSATTKKKVLFEAELLFKVGYRGEALHAKGVPSGQKEQEDTLPQVQIPEQDQVQEAWVDCTFRTAEGGFPYPLDFEDT